MKKYDELGTYSTLVFTSPNCWTSSAWMLEENEKKKSILQKIFWMEILAENAKKKKRSRSQFFFFLDANF